MASVRVIPHTRSSDFETAVHRAKKRCYVLTGHELIEIEKALANKFFQGTLLTKNSLKKGRPTQGFLGTESI